MRNMGRAAAGGLTLLLLPLLIRSDDATTTRQFTITRGEAYGLTVSITNPERFITGRIEVQVRDPQGMIATKTLHPFDLDLSVNLKPRGPLTVTLTGSEAGQARIDLAPLKLSGE